MKSSRRLPTSRLTMTARPSRFRGNLSQKPSSASGVDVAVCFLDTSTVVKRYVLEIGTAWVQALAAPITGHSLLFVRMAPAETVAAATPRKRRP